MSIDRPRVRVETGTRRSGEPGVALLTIDRPEVLNALDVETMRQLVEALEGLDADPACRCIVLTGAGERAFAAGADIERDGGRTTATSLAAAVRSRPGTGSAGRRPRHGGGPRLRARWWLRAGAGVRHGGGRG